MFLNCFFRGCFSFQDESVLDVADKDIIEYLELQEREEQDRLASANAANVLVQASQPLKRS